VTPEEFLYAVREHLADHSLRAAHQQGVKDPAFAEIVRERATAGGHDPGEIERPAGLETAVAEIAEKLGTSLAPADRSRLSQQVAIGGLDNSSVNAACIKSPDGVFAIVVNYGLMMFLHKFTKLMQAALSPESVIYCNRAEPSRLVGPDYFGFAMETVAYAQETGQVAGATVAFDAEMTAMTGLQVHLAETFVLAHEIGHFMSGHLDDDENYISLASDGSMLLFAESPDHQREFEADEYGFDLLRLSEPDMPPDVLAIVTLAVFQALAAVGGDRSSDSHPAASVRAFTIIDRAFTPSSAAHIHDWVEAGAKTRLGQVELQ
jgi:hypothetical protein